MGFREIFGDIAQGAGDVTRAGFVDIQNHYTQSVWGQPAPVTAPTADMEYVATPQEAEPQSYGAALRTHSDLEQTEIRSQYEAGQGADTAPSPASMPDTSYSPTPAPPAAPSYEPEV